MLGCVRASRDAIDRIPKGKVKILNIVDIHLQFIIFICLISLFIILFVDVTFGLVPGWHSGWILAAQVYSAGWVALFALCYSCCACCCFCHVKCKPKHGAGYKIGVQDALVLIPLLITIAILYGIVGIPSSCSKDVLYYSAEAVSKNPGKTSLNITDCHGYPTLNPENEAGLGGYKACDPERYDDKKSQFDGFCALVKGGYGLIIITIVLIILHAVLSLITDRKKWSKKAVASQRAVELANAPNREENLGNIEATNVVPLGQRRASREAPQSGGSRFQEDIEASASAG